MSLLLFGFLFSLPVRAEPILRTLPKHLQVQELPHGPDGPLPDDGFEFKDDGDGGNLLAKLGLVCIVASGVTGILALRAETGSEDRDLYSKTSLGLLGGGVGLIALERVF